MKVLTTVLLVFLTRLCVAQDMTRNLSRMEADSIKMLLKHNVPDTASLGSLLKLAQYNILKPGEDRIDLDSAARYIEQATLISARVKSRKYEGYLKLTQAYLYRESGDKEKGKIAAEKAIQILKQTDVRKYLGLAYYEMASYYGIGDPVQLKQKIRFTELAAAMFDAPGDIGLKAFSLKMLADLYDYQGDDTKALEKLNLSYQIYKSVHYKPMQSVFELFASIYYSKADFIQALKYGLAALETAKSLKDSTSQLSEINNTIGAIYVKLKDYRKAIPYYKDALLIAEKYRDNTSVIFLMYNVVNDFIMLGETGEAGRFINTVPEKYLISSDPSVYFCVPMAHLLVLSKQKNDRSAKIYCDRLRHILYHDRLNLQNQTIIRLALIKYFIASKKYTAAIPYLEKNDTIQHIRRDAIALSVNYKLWFRLDSAMGRYQSALAHLLANDKLNDSISNDNQTRQLTQITTFYKNEEKETAIKLLEAKTRLQQTKLEHAENTRKWIIGLVILLFILLLVSIDRYRVKQRNNKLLEAKQERINNVNRQLVAQRKDLLSDNEWLMHEIHHRVKNNLHTVVSLLESQASFLKNDALKAIEKSQHRIYAMSLVHQNLYDLENKKTVDFSGFIPEFIRYLIDSYAACKRIHFQLDIQPVMLGISQAIPIALIINEAVTNAIQYAFPEDRKGVIHIIMKMDAEQVTLIIADDGIGIGAGRNRAPSDSLGLVLMRGLSKDIGGEIKVENNSGTRVSIIFEAAPDPAGGRFNSGLSNKSGF